MSRQLLSRSNQFYIGQAAYGKYQQGRPGVEMTPLYDFKVAPTLAVSTAVCASQGVTASVLALINGTLATAGVATFDTPRNIVAAWTTTSVMTVTGTDVYGEVMTEVSASGTSHTGKKAFKTITAITFSITVTAMTAGTGALIGVPFRLDAGDLLALRLNGPIDAGTFVPADTTSPATSSTGDVRGTIAAVGAFDGVKFLSVLFKVASLDTKVGSFGVAQA